MSDATLDIIVAIEEKLEQVPGAGMQEITSIHADIKEYALSLKANAPQDEATLTCIRDVYEDILLHQGNLVYLEGRKFLRKLVAAKKALDPKGERKRKSGKKAICPDDSGERIFWDGESRYHIAFREKLA